MRPIPHAPVALDTCPAAPRRASAARRFALRRWRDGALTAAAFGLVAALVLGTAPGVRHAGNGSERHAEAVRPR